MLILVAEKQTENITEFPLWRTKKLEFVLLRFLTGFVDRYQSVYYNYHKKSFVCQFKILKTSLCQKPRVTFACGEIVELRK